MAWYDQVHTAKRFRLGTRKTSVAGNEYVYLKGVASTAQYDAVLYDELFVTTRSLAATIGQFAVAQAAIDATTKFGWYLIYGTGPCNALASFADNTMIYTTSTAGNVDDSGAGAEEFVNGAFGRSALVGAVATLQLNYPYKHAANLD